MKKLPLFLFFIFFLLASPVVLRSTGAQSIVLHAQTGETVGSLFATAIGRDKCLLIPNIPEFGSKNKGKESLKHAFYTTRAGKIPMQSFVNFIERGHILFYEHEKQKAYKNALTKAIKAHKIFYTDKNQTEKSKEFAHQNLIAAEIEVFKLLDTIKLAPDNIRTLEQILAIQKKGTFFEKLLAAIQLTVKKVVLIITGAWRNFFEWGLAYFALSAMFLLVPCLMYATDSPYATFANWIPFHVFFTIPWLIGGILYGGILAVLSLEKNSSLFLLEYPLKEPEVRVIIVTTNSI